MWGMALRQTTLTGLGRAAAVTSAAVIGLALTGFFALTFLWRAAYLYSQVHLLWQPGVIAAITVLEIFVLGRAILRAATVAGEIDALICVILFELTVIVFFVGVPLL